MDWMVFSQAREGYEESGTVVFVSFAPSFMGVLDMWFRDSRLAAAGKGGFDPMFSTSHMHDRAERICCAAAPPTHLGVLLVCYAILLCWNTRNNCLDTVSMLRVTSKAIIVVECSGFHFFEKLESRCSISGEI